jgi:hypothetical protein
VPTIDPFDNVGVSVYSDPSGFGEGSRQDDERDQLAAHDPAAGYLET